MTGVLEVFKTAVYLNAKQKAASLNGISPWNPSRKVTRRPYKPNQKSPWRLTLKPTKGHEKALQAHPTDKEVQTRDLIYCHKRGSSAGHNDLPYSPQKRPWEGYCWPEPDWRHPPTSPWNDGTTCAEWDSFGSETRTRASPAVHAEVLCGHVWKNKNKHFILHNYDFQFHVQGFKLCSIYSNCSYNQQGSPGAENQLAVIHNLQSDSYYYATITQVWTQQHKNTQKKTKTSIQPFQNCCDPKASQDHKKIIKAYTSTAYSHKCEPERHGNSLRQKTCITSFPHGGPHEHLIFFFKYYIVHCKKFGLSYLNNYAQFSLELIITTWFLLSFQSKVVQVSNPPNNTLAPHPMIFIIFLQVFIFYFTRNTNHHYNHTCQNLSMLHSCWIKATSHRQPCNPPLHKSL